MDRMLSVHRERSCKSVLLISWALCRAVCCIYYRILVMCRMQCTKVRTRCGHASYGNNHTVHAAGTPIFFFQVEIPLWKAEDEISIMMLACVCFVCVLCVFCVCVLPVCVLHVRVAGNYICLCTIHKSKANICSNFWFSLWALSICPSWGHNSLW